MQDIFHRVSVRKFESRAVKDEKITAILRAAMAAPSAGNQQPWEFFVVRDAAKIEALSNCSEYAGCAAGAPVVIVPCFTEGNRFQELAQIDLAIASEHIWLEADAQGLGAVWLAVAPFEERMRKVREIIGCGENLHPFALFPIGYAAQTSAPKDRFKPEKIHYL